MLPTENREKNGGRRRRTANSSLTSWQACQASRERHEGEAGDQGDRSAQGDGGGGSSKKSRFEARRWSLMAASYMDNRFYSRTDTVRALSKEHPTFFQRSGIP